jgi:pimeloyl-ACP methyl ester carboxylesterase
MLQNTYSPNSFRYIIVCVSYRGYWTSKGRPSEKGIAKDAEAALQWIKFQQEGKQHSSTQHVSIILWGQSIGAAVAANLAAREGLFTEEFKLRRLVLETPFISAREMLATIYPQRWLPYRYLWPFLWNCLDTRSALEEISWQFPKSPPDIVILEAGKDELVPKLHGDALEKTCISVGLVVRRHVTRGALHSEIMNRSTSQALVVRQLEM